MLERKIEERKFISYDSEGKKVETICQYEIELKEGKLIQVRNQYLYPIDRKSDSWNYFSNKYNK